MTGAAAVIEWLLTLFLGLGAPAPAPPHTAAPPVMVSELDLVSHAVEGAESSWGADLRMWRADLDAPQGPMQVSRAAALDVGFGNRFDLSDNRVIGRAYLAAMYRRYGNWPDAVIAYNWGPAHADRWIADGRPSDGLAASAKVYLARVMLFAREALARAREAGARWQPAVAAAPPPAPDPPELKDPKLRKALLRDTAAIRQLQAFLAATGADGAAGDTPPDALDPKAVLQTIRATAARPGFEEFRLAPGAARRGPADLRGLRAIALVLVARLKQESAALVLVDEMRRRMGTN